MGLHANPGRLEEPGPPRRPLHHRTHPTRRRHSARAPTPDGVAYVSAGTLAGARGGGLLTTQVWTARGLVTYYIVFVFELHSRRVQLIGCTPYPDEAFVIQCLRQVTGEPSGLLRGGRILLCDRDPKWSRAVEQWLGTAGIRVVRTPPRAPNCNAYAERFVRSVKEECLNHVVPIGNGSCVGRFTSLPRLPSGTQSSRTGERADRATCRATTTGGIRRRQRVGGILSYYYRSAA